MPKFGKPLAGVLAAFACLLAMPAQAHAQDPAPTRSITPQDLVELEAFGRATISPDGRWAVYEKRGAYNTATHFDYGIRAAVTIMDLWVLDLADPTSTPEQLIPGEGPGLQRLVWSPDSRRLLITRLRDERLELGIVTVATRQVEWTGLTPDMPRTGATAEWVSDDAFVVSTLPGSALPEPIRYEQGTQARTSAAWARSAEGEVASRTVTDAQEGLAWTETPEPAAELLLVDLGTGERRVLADRRTMDFAVSPDRSKVAVVQAGEVSPLATGRVTQIEKSYRQRLRLIDLSDGEVFDPLPGKDVASALLRWSPASDAVLVWAREDGQEWTDGDLTVVREAGAEVVDLHALQLGTIDQVARGVWADWIGGSPVVYAQAAEGERYDWYRPVAGASPLNLTRELGSPPIRRAASSDDDLTLIADGAVWALEANGVQRLTPSNRGLQAAVPADAEQVRRFMYNEAPRRNWVATTGPAGVSAVVSDGAVRTFASGDGEAPRILAVSPASLLVI